MQNITNMKYIQAKKEIIMWILSITENYEIKRTDLINLLESIIEDIKQNN